MNIHLNDLLFSLSRALDCVEREVLGVTLNHSKRVAYISMRLCALADSSDEEVFDMASCAILHDNALTEYSLAVGEQGLAKLKNVSLHCKSGENNARGFPFIGDTRNIILHHHENWDGSGFFGIRHTDVSLRAAALRMGDNVDLNFALGESQDSMAEKLYKHLKKEREIIYHPELVDVFLKLIDQGILDQIVNSRIDAGLAAILPSCAQDIPSSVLLKVCSVFASIIDSRSRFTLRHTLGIAQKTAIMAASYGFSQEHTDKLVIAAYLHDIGKLTIPKAILEKNGPLSDEEFKIIKGHATASHEILHAVRGFEDVSRWAPSHHEKLDGTGYPFGKKAADLDQESRLLACVDIYQALMEDRPYRAGLGHKKSIEILYSMAKNGKIDGDIVADLDKIFCDGQHNMPHP